jgi:CDP-2,3-bis-(O-geranylgeranyl)-sn-glycerol synthase
MVFEIFNIYILVECIWLVLPAYAANGFAPLARGRRAIDGGRMLRGKPLLGPGKTWEGLALGVAVAVIVSLIEMFAYPYLPWGISPAPLAITAMSPLLGFLLGLGAIAGDAAGSFLKRRLGMKRGASAPLLDQDDFIVGSLLFAMILVPVRIEWWILLLVITPFIHLLACAIGYILKVKKTPY